MNDTYTGVLGLSFIFTSITEWSIDQYTYCLKVGLLSPICRPNKWKV